MPKKFIIIISVIIFLFSILAYSIDLSFMGLAGPTIRGSVLAREADICSRMEKIRLNRSKGIKIDWDAIFQDPNIYRLNRKFAKQYEKERLDLESQKEDFSFLDKFKPLGNQEQEKTTSYYVSLLNKIRHANKSEEEKIEDLRQGLDRDLKYKLDQMKRDMESEMMWQKIRFESELFQKRLEIESDIRWAITTDMMFRRTFPNYKPYNFWVYLYLLKYFYWPRY